MQDGPQDDTLMIPGAGLQGGSGLDPNFITLTNGEIITNGHGDTNGQTNLDPEEVEQQKADEERKRRDEILAAENVMNYRCGLCKRPRYFKTLWEIHEHLLEFHCDIVPNDEEVVNSYIIPPVEPPPTIQYPSTKELLGEMEEEVRDPLIFEPQTFRPTYEEFKDLRA